MRVFRPACFLALLVLLPGFGAVAEEKPKPSVVLVEADGRDEELSAFVARFESELSDDGKVSFSDARLSGATLGTLVAEPEGEAARAFRSEWPGQTWLAISLSPCDVKVSRMPYTETTPEGYRVQRYFESVSVVCEASLRLVDAATGKEGKGLAVKGTASYRRDNGEEGESSDLEGSRDAAKKAARKLSSLLKR